MSHFLSHNVLATGLKRLTIQLIVADLLLPEISGIPGTKRSELDCEDN